MEKFFLTVLPLNMNSIRVYNGVGKRWKVLFSKMVLLNNFLPSTTRSKFVEKNGKSYTLSHIPTPSALNKIRVYKINDTTVIV